MGSAASDDVEDRSSSPPSRRPQAPPFLLELARMAGEAVGRTRAAFAPPHRGSPRPTEDLLRELGALLEAHKEAYGALAEQPRFWALIRHLHTRHQDSAERPRGRRVRAADLPENDERAAGPAKARKPEPTRGAAESSDQAVADAAPTEASDAPAEPADAKPADAKPADAEQAEAEPGDADPGDADPEEGAEDDE